MTGKTSTQIREQVKEAYTEALKRVAGGKGGCCGGSPGPAGAAAQLVDYGEDTQGLPGELVSTSFGCGNPLAFAEVTSGQTVLDLGSGAGLDLLVASRKVGATGKVIGIDMNETMLDTARENIRKAGAVNVELRQGIIEELPVENASVDWIISNCVINLSPEKTRVFAEINRVLRPGGRFSISDIVTESLPAALREHAAAYAACIAGAISQADYQAGLEAAGLTDIQVTDKHVYSAEELRGLVASDLESAGLPADLLDEGISQAAGQVASIRITGRRPS